MKLTTLLTSVVAMLAMPLHAAELSAANGASILYINGQAATEKTGVNTIEPGFTQAVVRFDDKLGDGSKQSVFTSKPFIIQFNAQDANYEIVPPKVYTHNGAEIEFDKAKPAWVLEQDGLAVGYDQEVLPGKQGFLPYAGMANLVAEYNKQRGIYFNNGQLMEAPVVAELAEVPAAVVKAESQSAAKVVAVEAKTVEQLKAWYLRASKEERKEFRRWMIDQE